MAGEEDDELFYDEEEGRDVANAMNLPRVEDDDLVDLEASDDDDEEKELSRRERRRQRGEVIRQNEELRQQLNQTTAQVAELRAIAERAQPLLQGTQQNPEHVQLRQVIDHTYTEEERLREHVAALQERHARAGTQIPAETQAEIKARARSIELTRLRAVGRLDEAERGVRPVSANEVIQQQVRAKHPDVFANERATMFARSTYDRRVALGEQPSEELLNSVMDETRENFNMQRRPQGRPTQARRDKLTGVGAGGGRPNGGRQGDGNTVRMDRATRAIALEFYSHKPDWDDARKLRQYARDVLNK